MLYESEHIEFKRELTPELCKSVIAFANTTGGKIYIGFNDDGSVAGIDNIDDTYTRITNMIRDSIAPDITMFVKYKIVKQSGISLEIGEGTAKPYYLKAKGLKPTGVFVRQGASSVPASPEQIRQFIKEADGDNFEVMRSLEQNLSFQKAAAVFAKENLAFDENKFYGLGLRNLANGMYNNLALLLSDQCQHTIKVAVFEDNENTVFKAHREFKGSLFEQLENAYAFLMLCNQNSSTFNGLSRIDTWDYPEAAIREALLNALIHRDYSFSGSIIININKNCMEFISLGGLLPGLAPEDIRSGISQPRNEKLAEVFHRLKFIESYGTGIRRIYALYKGCYRKPKIDITPHTFKITLYNMHTSQKPAIHLVAEECESRRYANAQQRQVLEYLQKHGEASDEDLQNLLGLKRTRAYLIAKEMLDKGFLEVKGRGEKKRYFLAHVE